MLLRKYFSYKFLAFWSRTFWECQIDNFLFLEFRRIAILWFHYILYQKNLVYFHFMSPNESSGNFQLSPDFRQRASSNASSVGRLSPIPALLLDNDWNNFSTEFIDDDVSDVIDGSNTLLEELAGTLADELTLQSDFLNQQQGSVCHQPNNSEKPQHLILWNHLEVRARLTHHETFLNYFWHVNSF